MKCAAFYIIFFAFALQATAQQSAVRRKIDEQRYALNPTENYSLGYGRDWVRMDSTYYPGWMFQGLFLYDRSADALGYQRALPYLRTAMVLMEHDFAGELKNISLQFENYLQSYDRLRDYEMLATSLRECYEYLDKPDSAMWVLQLAEQKKFVRDNIGLYGAKAWLIHRNRFYTDGRYSFLKSSASENAKLALESCYQGFRNIAENEPRLMEWFGEYAAESQRLFLYHYLAMIHSYLQQYDSSEYYYGLMSSLGNFSYNNYGSLKLEEGAFADAIQMYEAERDNPVLDKRLREPYYYLPMLHVYAGNTRQAIATAAEAISFSQSMPGFGWYNIALARSYLYNGRLDSADKTLQKAAAFREVHIGTTLTQPQYEITIYLLRLIWYDKKIAFLKRADKGWWYKPSRWYELLSLMARRYADKYALGEQLAGNPERERVLYDLFCGESTISFDEIYAMMAHFSPAYFEKVMGQQAAQDPRALIVRYFELGRAKMLLANGKKEKARNTVNMLIANTRADGFHEKLFLARLWEIKAAVSEGQEKQEALNRVYELYPSLIPYSGQPFAMALTIEGEFFAKQDALLKGLENTDIRWRKGSEKGIPSVILSLDKKGNRYELTINTRNAANEAVVSGERLVFREEDDVTHEVLQRIFATIGPAEPEF